MRRGPGETLPSPVAGAVRPDALDAMGSPQVGGGTGSPSAREVSDRGLGGRGLYDSIGDPAAFRVGIP
ncbi:hypothetical protein GCM10017600_11990 [Streptosporangium carneum]|uniref:Uncharacterized protein n=1 Tax=Streptosporangium carneum TaxID=47481 RepID=A0A9W6MAY5_9ACTN|nr:hypothetical protein GCM10017600_11990 [Streptosporangium carneum]